MRFKIGEKVLFENEICEVLEYSDFFVAYLIEYSKGWTYKETSRQVKGDYTGRKLYWVNENEIKKIELKKEESAMEYRVGDLVLFNGKVEVVLSEGHESTTGQNLYAISSEMGWILGDNNTTLEGMHLPNLDMLRDTNILYVLEEDIELVERRKFGIGDKVVFEDCKGIVVGYDISDYYSIDRDEIDYIITTKDERGWTITFGEDRIISSTNLGKYLYAEEEMMVLDNSNENGIIPNSMAEDIARFLGIEEDGEETKVLGGELKEYAMDNIEPEDLVLYKNCSGVVIDEGVDIFNNKMYLITNDVNGDIILTDHIISLFGLDEEVVRFFKGQKVAFVKEDDLEYLVTPKYSMGERVIYNDCEIATIIGVGLDEGDCVEYIIARDGASWNIGEEELGYSVNPRYVEGWYTNENWLKPFEEEHTLSLTKKELLLLEEVIDGKIDFSSLHIKIREAISDLE